MMMMMMRISLESPGLTAARNWLAGLTTQPMPRVGRSGSRTSSRTRFRKGTRIALQGEELEPRTLLDAGMVARLADLIDSSDTGSSKADNITYDTTPSLAGGVRGAATKVQLFINGTPYGDPLNVANGRWAMP